MEADDGIPCVIRENPDGSADVSTDEGWERISPPGTFESRRSQAIATLVYSGLSHRDRGAEARRDARRALTDAVEIGHRDFVVDLTLRILAKAGGVSQARRDEAIAFIEDLAATAP